MQDQHGKYIRLFGTLFFTFIGFILALIILMLGVKLLFGLLSYIPWFVYVYMLFIIAVPATLFISVYLIYFKRTASHPSAPVRYISWCVFTVALLAWGIFFVLDIITFFRHSYNDIGMYTSYNMYFLSANVAAIFLVGIMQALSAEKEKDWMERNNDSE